MDRVDFDALTNIFQQEIPPNPPKLKDPKDIWNEDDAETCDLDPRATPEYTVTYLQKVCSEDMYLGINGKTPSFGDSDELKCVIDLPGAKSSEIAINCTEFVLEVSSPKL